LNHFKFKLFYHLNLLIVLEIPRRLEMKLFNSL